MTETNLLFDSNRVWAADMEKNRPGFFTRLTEQQSPKYMWIGCSDSRVPANEIVGLDPGEIFVHRNIANVVIHSDLNAMSTIQFAVDRLHVKHVMVVGHYGCSGVQAVLEGARLGLADNWLRHIHHVRDRHSVLLDALPESARLDALCELNVIEQVMNVAKSTVFQDAWARSQDLTLHGWVYGLHDGLLQDLHVTVTNPAVLDQLYGDAVLRVRDMPRR
jgi:carbonic anhydrase